MTDASLTEALPARVRMPAPPTVPRRAPFPLVASIAPVLVAGVLWAITRSPFMLLFAFMGPAVALAGMADAARTGRKARRRAEAAFDAAVQAAEERIASAHAHQRMLAWERSPSATDAFLSGPDDPRRWIRRSPGAVVIGSGRMPSEVELEESSADDGSQATTEARERLRSLAATLDDMPVACDAAGGIGIVGEAVVARAMLRGIVLQLFSSVQPDALGLASRPEEGWEWLDLLPTGADPDLRVDVFDRGIDEPVGALLVREPGTSRRLLFAMASTVAALPAGCGTIIVIRSAVEAEIVRDASARGARVVPELVSTEQADAHARVLRRLWPEPATTRLPASVHLSELPTGGSEATGALACVVGCGADGPVSIDLVADGPHAVIGGTTGSGKSELLVTWLTALSEHRSPSRFSFLVIDFKGAATGTALARLPHCAGVVSDLDGDTADRALTSLRAEMTARERMLADAGVREFSALPDGTGPARLVIVVDELAALLARTPELHSLFADIAARGRSLGLHLLLCTQRPAGVVRDSLFANCSIRLSLRVNDAADSVAVVGSADAARFPREAPGRCILTVPGRSLVFQVAETRPEDLERVRVAHRTDAPAAQPWLEPLPARMPSNHPFLLDAVAAEGTGVSASARGSAAGRGVLLGLIDEPSAQRRSTARWDAGRDALLVVGSARSGVTTVLAVAADALRTTVVGPDVELAWDAIHDETRPVVIDDWDALAVQWSHEHREVAIQALERRIRRGDPVAIGTHRAGVGTLGAAFGARLVLRLEDRADHVQSGAPADLWAERATAGAGVWNRARFQAVLASEIPTAQAVQSPLRSARGLLIVCPSPRITAAAVREADAGASVTDVSGRMVLEADEGVAPRTYVGDVDAWMSQPSAFSALHSRLPVAFDGCSLAELRQLLRTRDVPPALRAGSRRVWLAHPDGSLERARPGW